MEFGGMKGDGKIVDLQNHVSRGVSRRLVDRLHPFHTALNSTLSTTPLDSRSNNSSIIGIDFSQISQEKRWRQIDTYPGGRFRHQSCTRQ